MATISTATRHTFQLRRAVASYQSSRRAVIALALFLLIIYASFPTKNYYWDGIGFALNIERLDERAQDSGEQQSYLQGVSSVYFNPNHLLYNLSGYLVYEPMRTVFSQLRAHDMLRWISMCMSIATACLVFISLRRWTRNSQLSLWLTLLMAFSATWWKFSTDANAYVPSTCLLMIGMFRLTKVSPQPNGWSIGLLHAMSMLLHQIAIFIVPAAIVGLWLHPCWRSRSDKQRAVCRYLLAAGLPVVVAYAWVWFAMLDGTFSSHKFLAWLTSNGSDTYSFQSVGMNSLESLRSLLRVFFGGRVRLALEFLNHWWLAALGIVMILCLTGFGWTMRRIMSSRRLGTGKQGNESAPPEVTCFIVWAGVFTVFQFIWLTEYPYYRLFCLPAMVFLMAASTNRSWSLKSEVTRAFAALVIFMATFNFSAYIYPYAQEAASPPIQLANQASTVWRGNEVILYKDFTCDNWIMRYFNNRTTWVKTDLADEEGLARHLDVAVAKGQTVWIDTTLLGQLKLMPHMRNWFQRFGGLSAPWGLTSDKHYIQLSKVLFR